MKVYLTIILVLSAIRFGQSFKTDKRWTQVTATIILIASDAVGIGFVWSL